MTPERTGAETPLQTELVDRYREFAAAPGELTDIVDGVDDETFNRRPEPASWSMAECVDHLVTTGEHMIPAMLREIERGRAAGKLAAGPFRYGRLGDWFVEAAGDGRLPPRRFKVPRLYAPAPAPDTRVADSVNAFEALQDRYLQVVRAADGLDLARVKVRSPAFWLLRLSLGQWLRMLSGHQRRHLWQAARVKARLGADGSPD